MAKGIELRTRPVGSYAMNAYVLVCPVTHVSVLVDPGDEPDVLTELLAGSTPVAILITHSHADHIGVLDEMKRRLNVPVMACDGPHAHGIAVEIDRKLRGGEEIAVGQHVVRAIATPGHTMDMLSFSLGDGRVLVGDTLFAGGPGRTWTADEFRRTLATLGNVILSWPDATECYPGHGPRFRLGAVRPAIEQFLGRDHGDFFGDASWE
ncbi:MAG: MBL fold metallo-hydrolase [Herpetosiphon sp.]